MIGSSRYEYLATHVNNFELDGRRFWGIYVKAEELGWTIFLHPIGTIGRERLDELSAAERELILGQTAVRLLRLT
jgi:hypothetical protein